MPWDDSGDYIRSGHRDPSTAKTCRTIDISADQGIKAIYCKFPDGWAIQSYLFSKDKWTMDKAKAWFAAHKESEFTEKLGETRHPDFEKIFQAFMWRYCKDKKECEEGKSYYYGWLKNTGLDDTKPYQRPQESFDWIKPHVQFMKEDEKAEYFKIEALFPLSSMNNNVYTREELIRACRTLIGKPTNLNHTDQILPEVQTVDADYEDDIVGCLDRVEKGSKTLQMIKSGEILQVSVEAQCLRGTDPSPEGNICRGQIFCGKAYLTKDVLPGVPLTRIMSVEKLVESFTVTSVTNLNEEEKGKENPQTENKGQQSGQNVVVLQTEEAVTKFEEKKANEKLTEEMKAEVESEGKIEQEKEVLEKIEDLQGKYEALKSELEQLKKPKEEPKQEPKKEPCKCLLTKEGFWARFHQLRSEGLSKSDSFRLVSLEVLEATSKQK